MAAEQMQIVYGPLALSARSTIIYSVTLANGYVVTNPEGFGDVLDEGVPLAFPQPLPTPQLT